MKSSFYVGRLRHRRLKPLSNEFTYPVFMVFLDLDETQEVFAGSPFWSVERFNVVSFRRSDYFGDPGKDLKSEALRRLKELTGLEIKDGRVRLLTHLRYFGHCFNPVSFYYFYDREQNLRAILTEIENTPWGERHQYAHLWEAGSGSVRHFSFAKAFHVSPFLPMETDYKWALGAPLETLSIHMENFEGGEKHFDATLTMDRREFDAAAYRWPLTAFPFMTLKVIFWIYFQALKLWWKGSPFYSPPKKREGTSV